MSILKQQEKQPNALANQVQSIKRQVNNFPDELFRQWSCIFDLMWNRGQFTPAQKFEEIGPDGAELIGLSQALTVFMITSFSGRRDDLVEKIQTKLKSISPLVINKDGTVTIEEEKKE